MSQINSGESAYLDVLRKAVTTGYPIPTRNGERFTIIGESIKFSLVNNTLPLMTTRKLPFKVIARELDWFLSGSVNVTELQDNNCHIWDKWVFTQEDADDELVRICAHVPSSCEFAKHEDAIDAKVNTIGPMYGATWRAKFKNGEDQVTRLIRELKAHPYSTQHILTTYNPSVKMDETKSCAQNILIGNGALTPCHGLHTQFICLPPLVAGGKPRLHCVFTNRSQDLPVGTVFNIAMYALLTHLIAHLCGFEAVELTWVGMHCHVYPDQIQYVEMLIERTPYAFPQIAVSPLLTNIDQSNPVSDYFTLVNYVSHDKMTIPVTG